VRSWHSRKKMLKQGASFAQASLRRGFKVGLAASYRRVITTTGQRGGGSAAALLARDANSKTGGVVHYVGRPVLVPVGKGYQMAV
jgi:hypothetical protein